MELTFVVEPKSSSTKNSTMKKTINFALLGFLILLFPSSAVAQKVFLEIKSSISSTTPKFETDGNMVDNTGSRDEAVFNTSIGVTAQLYKFVFLKTTIGSNDFNRLIELDWERENGSTNFSAWTHINQNFIEILPEFRFTKGKHIFVNAGFGLSQIKHVNYGSGLIIVSDGNTTETSFDDDSFPVFQGYNPFYALNVGANIPIKKVGILLEMGLRNSSTAKATNIFPKIGYKQVNYKLGLVYCFE